MRAIAFGRQSSKPDYQKTCNWERPLQTETRRGRLPANGSVCVCVCVYLSLPPPPPPPSPTLSLAHFSHPHPSKRKSIFRSFWSGTVFLSCLVSRSSLSVFPPLATLVALRIKTTPLNGTNTPPTAKLTPAKCRTTTVLVRATVELVAAAIVAATQVLVHNHTGQAISGNSTPLRSETGREWKVVAR